jgi:hypothetical protein
MISLKKFRKQKNKPKNFLMIITITDKTQTAYMYKKIQ